MSQADARGPADAGLHDSDQPGPAGVDDLPQSISMRDRQRVRLLLAVSLLMLVAAVAVRAAAPSPFAPRVHVRWADGLSGAEREAREQRFGLAQGIERAPSTWEYDLTDVSSPAIQAIVRDPAVADTHYIDRVRLQVAGDAPSGTTRLAERRAVRWIHSPLFEWFLLFWVSSILVSGVWLASHRTAAARA